MSRGLDRLDAVMRRHGGRVLLVLLAVAWLLQILHLLWTRWSWGGLGEHWNWAHLGWTPGPWTPGR